MPIEQWWRQLDAHAQGWLIENNGDSLPRDIAEGIVAAGGTAVAGEPLRDDDVDWIEAVANGEPPD